MSSDSFTRSLAAKHVPCCIATFLRTGREINVPATFWRAAVGNFEFDLHRLLQGAMLGGIMGQISSMDPNKGNGLNASSSNPGKV